jgi:hypothetical protein
MIGTPRCSIVRGNCFPETQWIFPDTVLKVPCSVAQGIWEFAQHLRTGPE